MSSAVRAEKLKPAVANEPRQPGLTETATLPQQPLAVAQATLLPHQPTCIAPVANKQRQFGLIDTATLPQQPLLTQCELDESNDADQVSRSSSRVYAC